MLGVGSLAYGGTSQGAINAGSYTITPQGLTSGNYTLSFVDGNLIITEAIQSDPVPPPQETVQFVQVASNSSGATVDAVLNFESSGVSVSLEQMPTSQDNGVIVVNVPKGSSTSGEGFSFQLSEKLADVVSKNRGKIRVKLPSGKAIPGWLKFDDKTLTFTAKAVPDGAFPVEVVLTIGSESFTVIISEKAESNSFI